MTSVYTLEYIRFMKVYALGDTKCNTMYMRVLPNVYTGVSQRISAMYIGYTLGDKVIYVGMHFMYTLGDMYVTQCIRARNPMYIRMQPFRVGSWIIEKFQIDTYHC